MMAFWRYVSRTKKAEGRKRANALMEEKKKRKIHAAGMKRAARSEEESAQSEVEDDVKQVKVDVKPVSKKVALEAEVQTAPRK